MADDGRNWAEKYDTRTHEVSAGALRYVECGSGRPLVLLHTLRTQLDMFHKMIPDLSERYRVIAVDLIGHGHSARPEAEYTPDYYTDAVGELLTDLELEDAAVVGESIGAGIALLLGSRKHPGVKQVVAVNPYDYNRGRGVHRSAWVANVMFSAIPVPVVGRIFWAMRSLLTLRMVVRGGVTSRDNVPEWLVQEIYAATKRPGDALAFMSMVKNFPRWETTREQYAKIAVPVDLVYGEHDWSHPAERTETERLIGPRTTEEVPGGGHFLSLDRPGALVEFVRRAAATE